MDIIENLKARCKAAGTNLTQLCMDAGVDRSVVERWKKGTKTLTLLAQLEAALQKREKEVRDGNA
jgi:hypothetical protein